MLNMQFGRRITIILRINFWLQAFYSITKVKRLSFPEISF